MPQRLLKRRIAEIDQTGAAPGTRDQFVRAEGLPVNGEHIIDRIRNRREGSLQHRHLFQPAA